MPLSLVIPFGLLGWGTTSFGGSISDKLLEVEVPVVSNAVCSAAMQNTVIHIKVEHSSFCQHCIAR